MTRSVAILGAAVLPVAKWQTPRDAELQVLEHEILARVVISAVADAGVERSEISSLAFAQPRPYTQQKYFATFIANYLRLPCTGSVQEVLGNGMTAALAFEAAANDIRLGKSRVALALGINFELAIPAVEHMMNSMRATGDVDFHAPFGFTPISWYAMDAARYIHEFKSSRAELASVSVKNRRHASLNPIAQFRKPITLDEVLAQKPIVEPLGLYEVPPRGDGAACIVLVDEEIAKVSGKPYVRVRGRGFFHEGAHQINEVPNDMIALISAQKAGQAAYQEAGVTAADIDLAELYAPCTIIEILASEALGLLPRGQGARLCSEGVTSLGGRIPVCTSGGLQSRGHPAHVTPFYSLFEVNEQLTGGAGERQVAGARLAVTSAELGNYNAALVHVLEAVPMTLTLQTIDRARAFPPRMTEFTRRFWQGLATGRFETTRCEDCIRLTFPPKPFCPHCWSQKIAWVPLSGRGRLYSQTVIHAAPAVFQDEVPYRVGIVDLDEGLRIATRVLADVEPKLDTAVAIVILNYRDGPLFAARPL